MKPETPTKTELRGRVALLEGELEVRTSQLEVARAEIARLKQVLAHVDPLWGRFDGRAEP